jgi:hypothetical protein
MEISPTATELTESNIKALVQRYKVPIIQYDYRTSPAPPPIVYQFRNARTDGYIVFVLQKGHPPLLLVTDSYHPRALTKEELPTGLLGAFETAAQVGGWTTVIEK